jgi:lipoprotein NlpI
LPFAAPANTKTSVLLKRMGASMRCVAICSALLLISAATADAQSRLKRDDTPAAAPAPAQKNARPARPGRTEQAVPPVDARPRLKRDDMPAAVAAPATTAGKGRAARVQGAGGPADVPAKGLKASARDIAACAQTAQPDAAIEGCTRVIEDPKHKPKGRAAAYFNRGNAYSAKGENERAIADYDEAIKLDPKNASAYNNRGSAKNDKGENEAALADFNAAIKQNARYASAYFNRASAYAAQGDVRALKDYDTAIRYNRRNTNAYIARGALLLASGATARARADMRQAAVLDRKNAYAVLWHDIAERRARQKGVLAGGKGLKDVEMKGWPAPVLLMFVGETKPEDLLIAADDANAAVKQAHTCEANFYRGQYALIGGKREEAVRLFRTAAKDCPRGFLEGIAAAAELKGMGEKVEAN